MSLSMYSCSIPIFVRYLNNLSAILEKGANYCIEKEIDETVLITGRLYPDMLPMSSQVQIACDMVKGAGARLSGIDAPKFEDNETNFAELKTRITKTLDFLQSLPKDKFNGTEEKQINMQAGPRELEFTGKNYLTLMVLPNLYFHITTTYNILRHNGVELGKMDYLGVV